MAEPADRRARKKAQTRALVLATAQRLFAERGFDAVTIADVAAAADVAVQTVFNHFSGKEELFFAERTPWLDGLADAVRNRPAGTEPLGALRSYTTDLVRTTMDESCTAERRAVLATLTASAALQNALPVVFSQAERRLAAALAEAWRSAGADGAPEARMAGSLTAALWTAATRTVLTELHELPIDPTEATEQRAAAEDLAKQVFDRLESGLATLLDVLER